MSELPIRELEKIDRYTNFLSNSDKMHRATPDDVYTQAWLISADHLSARNLRQK